MNAPESRHGVPGPRHAFIPGCDCPDCTWTAAQPSLTAAVHYFDQEREDRAMGLARWGSAPAAVRWYAAAYLRRSSARALTLGGVGGGGSDTQVVDRQFAAVAAAIGGAERDDRRRNPQRPAPVRQWLLEHFTPGDGRSCAWIAESCGWPEVTVAARLERALRVIRRRLSHGGWIFSDSAK